MTWGAKSSLSRNTLLSSLALVSHCCWSPCFLCVPVACPHAVGTLFIRAPFRGFSVSILWFLWSSWWVQSSWEYCAPSLGFSAGILTGSLGSSHHPQPSFLSWSILSSPTACLPRRTSERRIAVCVSFFFFSVTVSFKYNNF